MMDAELKGLAELALKNAYFRDLQDLVNRYSAAGLDSQIIAETNAWPNDDQPSARVDIWFAPGIFGSSTGCDTFEEAFEEEGGVAQRIGIEGTVVFERRDGEWHWVDNKEPK